MSKEFPHNLVGKIFKRGGGRYPGFWIVVGISPGGGCVLLGFDKEMNIVGATNYQPHYVDSKKAIGWHTEDITINIRKQT